MEWRKELAREESHGLVMELVALYKLEAMQGYLHKYLCIFWG